MPWRFHVDAIGLMLLGGEASGAAWADVLFGDVAPSGRLPIEIPATEADAIAPATSAAIVYTEGVATSYRNRTRRAAFAFGHGLGYGTPLELGTPVVERCARAASLVCIALRVRNPRRNTSPSRCVVQLYIEFGAAARHPPGAFWLKGFAKTPSLAPAGEVLVTLELSERDLSYYDAATRAWVRAREVTVHVGRSSADLVHSLELRVPAPRAGSAAEQARK